METQIQKQKKLLKIIVTLILTAAFYCCASPKKAQKYLDNDSFEQWVNVYKKPVPLKEKKRVVLNIQYVQYLNRVRQLEKQAESELNLEAAGKLTSLDYILNMLGEIDSTLPVKSIKYTWLPELRQLAPTFFNFIASKGALKARSYNQALTEIATCPSDHPKVVEFKQKLVAATLLDYATRFDEMRKNETYNQLAQTIIELKSILERHSLDVTSISFHNRDFPNYGAYLSELYKTIVDELERKANDAGKQKYYVEAINEIEAALEIMPEKNHSDVRRQQLIKRQQQIRKEGIVWHNSKKNKFEKSEDYTGTLLQLDTLCMLDKDKNCELERKTLQNKEFIKHVKKVKTDGGLLEAIKMLETPPLYAQDNFKVDSLLVIFKDEQGNLLVKEGENLFKGRDYLKAKSKFQESLKYLSKPEATRERILDCNKKYGDKLLHEGDSLLGRREKDYDEVRSKYEQARQYLGKEVVDAKILSCNDIEGRSLYPIAAKLAADNNCRGAAETIKRALKLVKREQKPNAEILYQRYKECATKKIAVILQANDATFRSSSEKYNIIDAVKNGIHKDEYIEILPSNDLPSISRNGSPISIANDIGANYVVAIAFDKPIYNTIFDREGRIEIYCQSTSKPDPYWEKKYDYHRAEVRIYADKADINVRFTLYLLEISSGAEKQSFSRIINNSWSKEYWHSSVKPEYIRYCPRGLLILDTPEKTSFVNTNGKFNQNREFPRGMDLIRDQLLTELRSIASHLELN